MYDTLPAIRDDIARRLGEGASNRRSAFHTPAVATAGADVRIMVLRAFDADTSTLRFHTDARAPKVAVIGDGAPVGVLFYDAEAKIQLRCHGTGRIEHAGAVADAAWEEASKFARRCYLGEGPGAVSNRPTSGLPDRFEGVEPSEADLAPARANFAVLLIRIESVDWFYLSNDGHIRAQFTGGLEDGEGRWVAP